ncbi:13809_t:CDS:2, partial [Cetraspora pellucida]
IPPQTLQVPQAPQTSLNVNADNLNYPQDYQGNYGVVPYDLLQFNESSRSINDVVMLIVPDIDAVILVVPDVDSAVEQLKLIFEKVSRIQFKPYDSYQMYNASWTVSIIIFLISNIGRRQNIRPQTLMNAGE